MYLIKYLKFIKVNYEICNDYESISNKSEVCLAYLTIKTTIMHNILVCI